MGRTTAFGAIRTGKGKGSLFTRHRSTTHGIGEMQSQSKALTIINVTKRGRYFVLRARARQAFSGNYNGESKAHLYNRPSRLTFDLGEGFEELLSSTNGLNRKLEEVLGMTKEYETIAALWHSFYELMSGSKLQDVTAEGTAGLPGTGGHTISAKQSTVSRPRSIFSSNNWHSSRILLVEGVADN